MEGGSIRLKTVIPKKLGEFKKRIAQIDPIVELKKEDYCWVRQLDLIKIVEEAKKEIPDFSLTNPTVSRYEIAADKWFKKWFGG